MTVEFLNIGDSVYFLNDNQKIDVGRITSIDFYAQERRSMDDENCRKTTYVIRNLYRRDSDKVFQTRQELIDSL